jgi:hypothetical protein
MNPAEGNTNITRDLQGRTSAAKLENAEVRGASPVERTNDAKVIDQKQVTQTMI